MFSLQLPERERALWQRILQLTSPSLRENSTSNIQENQRSIYSKTGTLASEHFSASDLEYLFEKLPWPTRKMLLLAGRDKPESLTVYDLRHSLVSTQGADAAVKIRQAELLCDHVMKLLKVQTFVRILEIGSGTSDVSSVLWKLLNDRLTSLGFADPSNHFLIANVEYETTTGQTAEKLVLSADRNNIVHFYGPIAGDATRLRSFKDNTFDVVFSSLMLGALGGNQVIKENKSSVARCNQVLDQARRVARDGALVCHTDFVYLYGREPCKWSAKGPAEPGCFKQGFPLRIETLFCGSRDLVTADGHTRRKVSPFLKEINEYLTNQEFEYWDWFDAGDYAAWKVTEDAQKGLYNNVTTRRFCGKVASGFRAALALLHLHKAPWNTLDDQRLHELTSHVRAAGVSFVVTTATVSKRFE